jgi:hypothetical protein
MVAGEQNEPGRRRLMSRVMWDMFTGSATYREVFLRALHPVFIWNLVRAIIAPQSTVPRADKGITSADTAGELGSVYGDGEVIIRQGDQGDCMYVIQEGRADVIAEKDGVEVKLRELGEGEIVGEMAIFDRVTRSATVRAVGKARVLTVDKNTLLTRIHQDPSLAFHIVRTMSRRIRDLSEEVRLLKGQRNLQHGDSTDGHS